MTSATPDRRSSCHSVVRVTVWRELLAVLVALVVAAWTFFSVISYLFSYTVGQAVENVVAALAPAAAGWWMVCAGRRRRVTHPRPDGRPSSLSIFGAALAYGGSGVIAFCVLLVVFGG